MNGPETGINGSTTDIYSLAKVLLQMLTGTRLSELLPEASMDLPERVRELMDGWEIRLSAASIDLIADALEYDPAKRALDVGAFASVVAADLMLL